jgi:hypothetical protein
VAKLSIIPKRFELLVYRTVYADLKNLISVNHTWLFEEPIDGDELVGVRFFLRQKTKRSDSKVCVFVTVRPIIYRV